MFKFVEQGSTSCHENRKSIQRKSRQRLLREQEEMLGGGVGWGGGYLRWTSFLFKGRGESTILPDAQRYRDRDELQQFQIDESISYEQFSVTCFRIV